MFDWTIDSGGIGTKSGCTKDPIARFKTLSVQPRLPHNTCEFKTWTYGIGALCRLIKTESYSDIREIDAACLNVNLNLP